jgi:uracil-DNA glycosylase
MTYHTKPHWNKELEREQSKPYFKNILSFLHDQYNQGKTIYPGKSALFNALKLTPLNSVKVVIIGQDPYHGPNQAHGLCFSVQQGIVPPPSLKNIFKELNEDLKINTPKHGCLESWAKQGVLLLNSCLSVEAGKPQSHSNIGWQQFTDCIIKLTNGLPRPVVYLLWGANAQKKASTIDNPKHLVLCAPHPSPLSAHRGFLGCRHFSKTNEYLVSTDRSPIDWQI